MLTHTGLSRGAAWLRYDATFTVNVITSTCEHRTQKSRSLNTSIRMEDKLNVSQLELSGK